MRTREANERTGHAPRDRPTAISQVLPKCPWGCPSLPMKVLDACQLRKREEKERRGLTRRIQDRKRTRERERGGGKRNSWWGGTGGGWRATSSFFYLGEEWTRELGGAAPGRHPPSISYSSSQDIDQNRCQDSDPVTCSPPWLQLSSSITAGRRVCPLPLFRPQAFTPSPDRRHRSQLPRPRQGAQQFGSERTLLLSQADFVIPTLSNIRGKGRDPSRRLGPS